MWQHMGSGDARENAANVLDDVVWIHASGALIPVENLRVTSRNLHIGIT